MVDKWGREEIGEIGRWLKLRLRGGIGRCIKIMKENEYLDG